MIERDGESACKIRKLPLFPLFLLLLSCFCSIPAARIVEKTDPRLGSIGENGGMRDGYEERRSCFDLSKLALPPGSKNKTDSERLSVSESIVELKILFSFPPLSSSSAQVSPPSTSGPILDSPFFLKKSRCARRTSCGLPRLLLQREGQGAAARACICSGSSHARAAAAANVIAIRRRLLRRCLSPLARCPLRRQSPPQVRR